nr:hypothetical protein CFP56_20640 [Quercus suber]
MFSDLWQDSLDGWFTCKAVEARVALFARRRFPARGIPVTRYGNIGRGGGILVCTQHVPEEKREGCTQWWMEDGGQIGSTENCERATSEEGSLIWKLSMAWDVQDLESCCGGQTPLSVRP